MLTPDREQAFDRFFSHYVALLAPLFKRIPRNDIQDLFEIVCCLVHPGGVESADENPLLETTALIDDLDALSRQEMNEWPDPERTKARLALLSYCHLTESEFFYVLLVNLLRVRCGERWTFAPFADLVRARKKKSDKPDVRIPPSPKQKINRITVYSRKAGLPQIGEAFASFYVSEIRNAVFHADYTLCGGYFHMTCDYWKSPQGYLTRDVPLHNLLELIDRACAFYYARFNCHQLARGRFQSLKNKAFPFEVRLKGLVEFLFEEDLIIGFRLYWPNGQQGQFTRMTSGSRAINIWPNPLGGLNIDVGLYASQPGPFSPLVERGLEPTYSPVLASSCRRTGLANSNPSY
jgi:hypothetical protein